MTVISIFSDSPAFSNLDGAREARLGLCDVSVKMCMKRLPRMMTTCSFCFSCSLMQDAWRVRVAAFVVFAATAFPEHRAENSRITKSSVFFIFAG